MSAPTFKKTYVILGVIVISIIGLHYGGVLSAPESSIKIFLYKPIRWMYSSSIKDGSVYSTSTPSILSLQLQIKLLTDENDELRSELNFKKNNSQSIIIAEILSKEINGLGNVVIINQGETAGIKFGQPVVGGDGVLVGEVIKIDKDSSAVRLINDNQSKIAATITNRDHSIGVVEGGYGLGLKMNFIPRDEVVLVGDQVITSGLENSIPKGLFIGTVAVIENEPYQPFQNAVLTPAINLSKLDIVAVIQTK